MIAVHPLLPSASSASRVRQDILNELPISHIPCIYLKKTFSTSFQCSAWVPLIWVFIYKIKKRFFFHILYKFDFVSSLHHQNHSWLPWLHMFSSIKSKKRGFFSHNFHNVCHLNECSHIHFTNFVFNSILVIIYMFMFIFVSSPLHLKCPIHYL